MFTNTPLVKSNVPVFGGFMEYICSGCFFFTVQMNFTIKTETYREFWGIQAILHATSINVVGSSRLIVVCFSARVF